MVVSLFMVAGVFLARWSLPALILGTGSKCALTCASAPHLIVWAILAGCLWAVANTLTVFAIRDIGLSIAFPLWKSNSAAWHPLGLLFLQRIRGAGLSRWLGVLGGTLIMCVGAAVLAIASSGVHLLEQILRTGFSPHSEPAFSGARCTSPIAKPTSGMNPLSFITFFTIGEVGMIPRLPSHSTAAPQLSLATTSLRSREVIFWLMLGGFIWVIGDFFQQYAAKYVGISRGIPLSNTNQLWGLLWGVLVFGEFHGLSTTLYAQVIGGSLLMAAGAGAIALSSVTSKEHARWKQAAEREGQRYKVDAKYVHAGLSGSDAQTASEGSAQIAAARPERTWLDYLLVVTATVIFITLAVLARAPNMALNWPALIVLAAAMLIFLFACGLALWHVTRFN